MNEEEARKAAWDQIVDQLKAFCEPADWTPLGLVIQRPIPEGVTTGLVCFPGVKDKDLLYFLTKLVDDQREALK